MLYEAVIGLETHIELATKTKLFCSCKNSFAGEPGSRYCPICSGHPGVLPALNGEAVKYALMAGMALDCEINKRSSFARKNYFYPDLPKSYQITQGDTPLCKNGKVILKSGKVIRIKRIHIEEDAGKLIHREDKILIDYNRCGVPLIEIVTEPDFENSSQVKEYLEKLRQVMRTIGVSDCRMQEGSLRCDVNLSVKEGNKNYNKVEIKNLNSINFIVKGIESEFKRQCDNLRAGLMPEEETRKFNEKTFETEPMRKKESFADYRYIEEPDLADLIIDNEFISEIKMQELPDEKTKRYMSVYNLSKEDAINLIKYPKTAEYFEKIADISGMGRLSASVILKNIFSFIKDETKRENAEFPEVNYIAQTVKLIGENVIKSYRVNEVVGKVIRENKGIYEIFNETDFCEFDETDTKKLCEIEITNNEKAVSDYKSGNKKAIYKIIGAVIKKSEGKVNPSKVEEIITELLK